MHHPIVLATAQVGQHNIIIELAGDTVVVRWPEEPLQASAAKFPDAAATLTRLFANASMQLARIKAGQKR
jgi:hypothetical protein